MKDRKYARGKMRRAQRQAPDTRSCSDSKDRTRTTVVLVGFFVALNTVRVELGDLVSSIDLTRSKTPGPRFTPHRTVGPLASGPLSTVPDEDICR